MKMLKPGVSRMLILFFFHSVHAMAVEMVILRWIFLVCEIRDCVSSSPSQDGDPVEIGCPQRASFPAIA